MRTLHFGLHVAELQRSLAFYAAVGYEVVGSVPETELGHLTMLKLPGDDFVTVELIHDPTNGAADPGAGRGFSYFVIKVASMHATLTALAAQGIDADAPTSPDGSDGALTTWITGPDGCRIELVQWPAGHPDGITAADWPTELSQPGRRRRQRECGGGNVTAKARLDDSSALIGSVAFVLIFCGGQHAVGIGCSCSGGSRGPTARLYHVNTIPNPL
jgi:lactoylglutathione lyase